jgi:hypothetical protein
MTDDTFLEPPGVFSDGNEVMHSYADVEAVLAEQRVNVFSVHVGEKGRGLSAPHAGRPPLVESTGGTWRDLSSTRSDSLERMLRDLLTRPDCR